MVLLFFLLLIGGPILELYVGTLVVDAVGFSTATLLLLIAAVAGVLVMRMAWRRRPRTPDSALLMLAGALLLLPGYVSDAVGVLLLLAPVRALIRTWVGLRVERRLASWNLTILRWDDSTGRLHRTDVVPGEVVVEEEPSDGVIRGEIVDRGPEDRS
ncbi:MAG TPA: FxsA family protein [Actinomycetes bacterium]|nr:FxsA family protein [Actinomycetes bacterium]